MSKLSSIRELLSQEEQDAIDPAVMTEQIRQDIHPPNSDLENVVHVLLPGDDVESSPLYVPPNPYLYVPRSELIEMSLDETDKKKRQLMIKALRLQELG